MSESNLKLRDDAVPFISWHQLDVNVSTTSFKYLTCPILANGNLIEAYLSLFMPVSTPVSTRLVVGEFDTDGVNPLTGYSTEYRLASQMKLQGNTDLFASSGGMLVIDGINLLPERAKFNEHGFVLQFGFSRPLTAQELQLFLERLLINCSSQMGLI